MKDILRIEKESTIKDFRTVTNTRFQLTESEWAHTKLAGKKKKKNPCLERKTAYLNKEFREVSPPSD